MYITNECLAHIDEERMFWNFQTNSMISEPFNDLENYEKNY